MKLTSEKKPKSQKAKAKQDMGIKPTWMSDEDMVQAIGEARGDKGESVTREEIKKSIRS